MSLCVFYQLSACYPLSVCKFFIFFTCLNSAVYCQCIHYWMFIQYLSVCSLLFFCILSICLHSIWLISLLSVCLFSVVYLRSIGRLSLIGYLSVCLSAHYQLSVCSLQSICLTCIYCLYIIYLKSANTFLAVSMMLFWVCLFFVCYKQYVLLCYFQSNHLSVECLSAIWYCMYV